MALVKSCAFKREGTALKSIDLPVFNRFLYALFFFIANCYPYAGDAFLQYGTSYQFSTNDRDNDVSTKKNCAKKFTGAWWYAECHTANLNGRYLYGQDNQSHAEGVVWKPWRGYNFSLKKTEIKLRPVQ